MILWKIEDGTGGKLHADASPLAAVVHDHANLIPGEIRQTITAVCRPRRLVLNQLHAAAPVRHQTHFGAVDHAHTVGRGPLNPSLSLCTDLEQCSVRLDAIGNLKAHHKALHGDRLLEQLASLLERPEQLASRKADESQNQNVTPHTEHLLSPTVYHTLGVHRRMTIQTVDIRHEVE